ncbi:Rab-GTPase-TBC domain [Pseudocohnilembus persalinus]|uniref:Rab-GTPase-TBC domain n=1 Tax=Pseudocohnilembus persalinus TaxID=266149 RepID=A0A0V0R7L0_PSEPJ|nr:Rab-GTPase-TBC domain [Pseudocohnilembus persalinus]|eukprot:KRX10476.1 Rab-GTPase-TBC domain [Pseudocohnilembus persalinus]
MTENLNKSQNISDDSDTDKEFINIYKNIQVKMHELCQKLENKGTIERLALIKEKYSRQSKELFQKQKEKSYYDTLKKINNHPDIFDDIIHKDLMRTPDYIKAGCLNQDFKDKEKQKQEQRKYDILYNVLAMTARRNNTVGYCQGMNFIAAFINKQGFNEEETFWLLQHLLEQICPIDYYTSMDGVTADSRIFSSLLKFYNHDIYEKFQKLNIDIQFFTMEWFITLYTNQFQPEIVKIVLDHIFIQGSITILKLGTLLHKEKILKTSNEFFAYKIQESLQVTNPNYFEYSKKPALKRKIFKQKIENTNDLVISRQSHICNEFNLQKSNMSKLKLNPSNLKLQQKINIKKISNQSNQECHEQNKSKIKEKFIKSSIIISQGQFSVNQETKDEEQQQQLHTSQIQEKQIKQIQNLQQQSPVQKINQNEETKVISVCDSDNEIITTVNQFQYNKKSQKLEESQLQQQESINLQLEEDEINSLCQTSSNMQFLVNMYTEND